jgi:hypothetical protein
MQRKLENYYYDEFNKYHRIYTMIILYLSYYIYVRRLDDIRQLLQ